MQRNLIRSCWVLLFGIYLTGGWLIFMSRGAWGASMPIIIFVFVFSLAIWAYLTFRIFFFYRELAAFLRYLYSGEYEAGIKLNTIFSDEVSYLGDTINKAADRLRQFDSLRAQKVSLNQRVTSVVREASRDGIVLADMDKREFQFNHSARAIFAIEQENISFEAVERQEANREFVEFFKKTTEKEKIPQEKKITLRLPVKNAQADLNVRIIPLKDKKERTRLAVIFIRPEPFR